MGRKKSNCSEVIIKNTDNKTAPEPQGNICSARSSAAKAMLEDDAPLVSIYVLAYDNLSKYTKTCVECIIKYTDDIDYELILIDNGSSDGTFEYFKSVQHPKKKVIRITKNIGIYYGGNKGFAECRGRFIVSIANDVFVTKNWLSNMLKCAMSDDSIGMVTPVSENISNHQAVNLGYTDFDDMQIKAEKYNISDPGKWEQRIRLITIGTMYKKECMDIIGLADYGFFHDFVDDDITFRVRRAGYKAILCKDVFVSHAGKITDKGASLVAQSLEKGRCTFKSKYYGIDAWGDVNNYEPGLMTLVNVRKEAVCTCAEILGIDVLCGSPILELKNRLRNSGVFDAKLSAFCSEAKYWMDLKTICEGKVEVDRHEYLLEHFGDSRFDYIVLGKPVNMYKEPYRLLKDMLKLLKSDAQLLIKLRNAYDARALLALMGYSIPEDEKPIVQVSLEALYSFLDSFGYRVRDVTAEFNNIDENTKRLIKKTLERSGITKDIEEALARMMVKDYLIDIGLNYL